MNLTKCPWVAHSVFVGIGAIMAACLLTAFSPPQEKEASNTANEELVRRIDKLLDEKLAKLKEDLSKDVKAQIDGNNKQVLGAAIGLQKSLKDSLGDVANRASSFERSFKVLLMQTSLFDEHGPSIGANQEPLDEQVREAYGLKRGDATRITKLNENSPAQIAGLQVADVVDWRVTEAKNYLPGDSRCLPIIRRGAKLTFQIRLTCKKCNSDLCPFTISEETKPKSKADKELEK